MKTTKPSHVLLQILRSSDTYNDDKKTRGYLSSPQRSLSVARKVYALFVALFMLLVTGCELEGPEGPPGPQGPEGSQGSPGPSGNPGMTANSFFVTSNQFTVLQDGKTYAHLIPLSTFPAVNAAQHNVVGYVQHKQVPTSTASGWDQYFPMPHCAYIYSNQTICWLYTYSISDSGRLWLYVRKSDNSLFNDFPISATGGWNFRFFVFKSHLVPSDINEWSIEDVEQYSLRNPDAMMEYNYGSQNSDEVDNEDQSGL